MQACRLFIAIIVWHEKLCHLTVPTQDLSIHVGQKSNLKAKWQIQCYSWFEHRKARSLPPNGQGLHGAMQLSPASEPGIALCMHCVSRQLSQWLCYCDNTTTAVATLHSTLEDDQEFRGVARIVESRSTGYCLSSKTSQRLVALLSYHEV